MHGRTPAFFKKTGCYFRAFAKPVDKRQNRILSLRGGVLCGCEECRGTKASKAISPLPLPPLSKGRAWGGAGDCFPLADRFASLTTWFTLSTFATLSVNSANVLGVATLAPHAHLPWRERKCQGVQVSARECRCDMEPTLQKPWVLLRGLDNPAKMRIMALYHRGVWYIC